MTLEVWMRTKLLENIQVIDYLTLTLSCRRGGGGGSAQPLRFFAHNSGREKDNSTKFGDVS